MQKHDVVKTIEFGLGNIWNETHISILICMLWIKVLSDHLTIDGAIGNDVCFVFEVRLYIDNESQRPFTGIVELKVWNIWAQLILFQVELCNSTILLRLNLIGPMWPINKVNAVYGADILHIIFFLVINDKVIVKHGAIVIIDHIERFSLFIESFLAEYVKSWDEFPLSDIETITRCILRVTGV